MWTTVVSRKDKGRGSDDRGAREGMTYDSQDLHVSLHEPIFCKLEFLLLAEGPDELAGRAEVVARQTGEQVVRHLLVQSAVDELDRRGTDDLRVEPTRGESVS